MIILLKFLELWSLRLNKKLTAVAILGSLVTLWFLPLFDYSFFQKITITVVSILFGGMVFWKDNPFGFSLMSFAHAQVCLVASPLHPLFIFFSDDIYEKYTMGGSAAKKTSAFLLVAISIVFFSGKNMITHYATLLYCVIYLLRFINKVLRDMDTCDQIYFSIRLLANLFMLESLILYHSVFLYFGIVSFSIIIFGILYKYLKYKKRNAWIKLNFVARRYLAVETSFRSTQQREQCENRKSHLFNKTNIAVKQSLEIEYIAYFFVILLFILAVGGVS